jgi:hypothetical protein
MVVVEMIEEAKNDRQPETLLCRPEAVVFHSKPVLLVGLFRVLKILWASSARRHRSSYRVRRGGRACDLRCMALRKFHSYMTVCASRWKNLSVTGERVFSE